MKGLARLGVGCFERGDCSRYGPCVLVAGEAVATFVAAFVRSVPPLISRLLFPFLFPYQGLHRIFSPMAIIFVVAGGFPFPDRCATIPTSNLTRSSE